MLRGASARPARLVDFRMAVSEAQERFVHRWARAAEEIAEDVVGFDRRTTLDVSQHR